jgi:quercetin dioxygenase-like cupin family protein
MRRVLVLFVAVTLSLSLCSVCVVAQTGTPAPSGITGVKVETLGRGASMAAPGYALQLIQLTFAPGGRIAMHSHPGDAVFYVESGTISWTTGSGTPLLTRAGTGTSVAGSPVPAEPLTAGAEVLLQTGDAVFYDQEATHDVRNTGSEPAVVLYSALRAADQPGITFTESTPTP